MTNQHPITPPPELVRQWTEATRYKEDMPYPEGYEQCEQRLCTAAARWGADMELEACCEWLAYEGHEHEHLALRAARRPKPPSLKEQALEQLDGIATCFRVTHMGDLVCDKIRKALEALPE